MKTTLFASIALLLVSKLAAVAAGSLGRTSRNLHATSCVGSVLLAGQKLMPGESICAALSSGEEVYFGVVVAPAEEPGYTFYQVKLWSSLGTYTRNFQGTAIPSSMDPPYFRFQRDGNVVFNGNSQSSGCLAKPGSKGLAMRIESNAYPTFIVVADTNNESIIKIVDLPLSNGETYIGGTECYPDQPNRCIDVFRKRERISWKVFLCDYDSDGNVVSQFGLDDHGFLRLWKDGAVVWHPGNKRGDYLHFQNDGHLTLYLDSAPKKSYSWVSRCIARNASKMTVADSDVNEFDSDGAVVWTLRGSLDKPVDICFK